MKSAVPNIDINPVYWREVVRLLRQYVPEFDVWAFGSRVKWTAKSHSDLDLAIITSEPLSLSRFAELREVFDESVLPFRVDIVDWAATSESFRRIIERDKLVIQSGQTSRVLSTQFPVFPLEECLEALIDYRGKTPEKTSSGIPLVTAKVIKGGRIEPPTEFIAPEDYDLWMRRGLPNPGDVVMTTEAPLGEVAQLGNEKVALAQRVITLRGKAGFLDNTYLLYLLQTEEMQDQLRARATGTTVLGIKQSELRKISVRVPPFGLQSSIAGILKSLDDRITLLRETNATLEAIAQALFKSWFVDFDPVHAKQQGRAQEGMDEATSALFPCSFEESELGLVPKGWRICCVSDVTIQIFSGGTPDTRKPEYWFGDLPWFSSGETREQVIVDTEKKINLNAVKNSSTKLALPGDILIASAGQGHTRGQTSYCSIKTYINQSVVSVRADSERCDSLWLFYNLSRRYAEMRDLSDSHSSRGSLTTKLLAGMRVLLPELPVLQAFGAVASVLMESQANNLERIATLSGIRDTLLPRLISGQLRLPEASSIS